jgi:hypothetical protein
MRDAPAGDIVASGTHTQHLNNSTIFCEVFKASVRGSKIFFKKRVTM